MIHPRFRSGKISANFIAEEFKGGFDGTALTQTQGRMSSFAVFMR